MLIDVKLLHSIVFNVIFHAVKPEHNFHSAPYFSMFFTRLIDLRQVLNLFTRNVEIFSSILGMNWHEVITFDSITFNISRGEA